MQAHEKESSAASMLPLSASLARTLLNASATDEAQQHHDDRDDKQDVDEAAHRVGGDQAK
jgi:hypothetical protein